MHVATDVDGIINGLSLRWIRLKIAPTELFLSSWSYQYSAVEQSPIATRNSLQKWFINQDHTICTFFIQWPRVSDGLSIVSMTLIYVLQSISLFAQVCSSFRFYLPNTISKCTTSPCADVTACHTEICQLLSVYYNYSIVFVLSYVWVHYWCSKHA